MLTPEQVNAWTEAALYHLDDLRGPVHAWEEAYPLPIRYCDGHAVHHSDLRELRAHFLKAAEATCNLTFSEDGQPLGVSVQSIFIALYSMIVNAERVYDSQAEAR